MSNMSYCRFENTLGDLEDCYDSMDETDELQGREKSSRKEIIELCCRIAEEYGKKEDD